MECQQQQPKHKDKTVQALVKPVLSYISETWKITKVDNKELDIFQSKCLRKILKISWKDHITNEQVMERGRDGDYEQSSAEEKMEVHTDTCLEKNQETTA